MGTNVKSMELWERAKRVMPGGHSNLRIPLAHKVLFMVKGKGAHLWDADGNDYIDFMCAAGPSIFGNGDEEYMQALRNILDTLYFTMSGVEMTPISIELAEKFVQHVPCAEKVRFCISGTEAVQLAIRLARAYTKRRYFIRFEGHYHGWLDNVLGGVVDDSATGRPFAVESDEDPLGTEGRDPAAFEQSFMLPWNDIDVLERVLEKYGEEVALIHMEPILCNHGCCPPHPGYLERARELCTKYGIVLCFDEVITGFRLGLSGAQGKLGVTPDIATFGKAMGAGIPISAVAGKKEIMDLLLERRAVGAGTFNGYTFGVSASLAAMKILEKNNGAFYRKIDAVQAPLMNGLKEISRRHNIPMLIQGDTGFFYVEFIDREVAYSVRDLIGADMERKTRFLSLLTEEGVLPLPDGRFYVCGAVTDSDVDRTLEIANRVMVRI